MKLFLRQKCKEIRIFRMKFFRSAVVSNSFTIRISEWLKNLLNGSTTSWKFFSISIFYPSKGQKCCYKSIYLYEWSNSLFDGFYFIDLWRNTFDINYVPDSAEAKTKNFKKQWIHKTWSKYDLWSKNFEINEKHKTFDRASCIIQNNCQEMSHQKNTVGQFWQLPSFDSWRVLS